MSNGAACEFGEGADKLRCFGAKGPEGLEDKGNECGGEGSRDVSVFGGLGGGVSGGDCEGCGGDGEVGRGTWMSDANIEEGGGVREECVDVGTSGCDVGGFDLRGTAKFIDK